MSGKTRFAPGHELITLRLIGRRQVRHRDVRSDPRCLNGASRRRVVSGRRQAQSTACLAAQWNDGLHRALTEGGNADHGGAPMVLQRTGDDFGGRRRTFIDEDHDRFVVSDVTRSCVVPLRVLRSAATCRDHLAGF